MNTLELLPGLWCWFFYGTREPGRQLTLCNYRLWPVSRSYLNVLFSASFKAHLRYLGYPPLRSRKHAGAIITKYTESREKPEILLFLHRTAYILSFIEHRRNFVSFKAFEKVVGTYSYEKIVLHLC